MRLAGAGVDSPRRDARLLVAAAMGNRDSLNGSAELDANAADALEKLIRRRIEREPIAYILGRKEFYGLDFAVGPGVLTPRPETETLLDELQRQFPDRSATLEIVDFGTGSGCLVVTALSIYPNARGVGIDQSEEAIRWAARNVARHGQVTRTQLIWSDWHKVAVGHADAVLANPPYVTELELRSLAPEVSVHEPHAALCGGRDGLDPYRTLAPLVSRTIKSAGFLFLEIGKDQGKAVSTILSDNGLRVEREVADLAGIPRCLVARRNN
jgi:release factor glutamine methyltransferase